MKEIACASGVDLLMDYLEGVLSADYRGEAPIWLRIVFTIASTMMRWPAVFTWQQVSR